MYLTLMNVHFELVKMVYFAIAFNYIFKNILLKRKMMCIGKGNRKGEERMMAAPEIVNSKRVAGNVSLYF